MPIESDIAALAAAISQLAPKEELCVLDHVAGQYLDPAYGIGLPTHVARNPFGELLVGSGTQRDWEPQGKDATPEEIAAYCLKSLSDSEGDE